MVECGLGPDRGPYCTAAMALQIAVIEYTCERKHAPALIFVKVNYGMPHQCRLVDDLSGDHCLFCENSWAAENRPLPPRCPLWEALREAAPGVKVQS
jgi:hypothetical protein